MYRRRQAGPKIIGGRPALSRARLQHIAARVEREEEGRDGRRYGRAAGHGGPQGVIRWPARRGTLARRAGHGVTGCGPRSPPSARADGVPPGARRLSSRAPGSHPGRASRCGPPSRPSELPGSVLRAAAALDGAGAACHITAMDPQAEPPTPEPALTPRQDDRAPLPPEVLADALQDRIHPTSGRLLGAKPVRVASKPTGRSPDSG